MAPSKATLALLMLLAGGVSADPPARPPEDGSRNPTSAPPATTPTRPVSPATVLSALSTDVVDGRLRITFRGNGRVEPAVARYARGMPPRVVIEIPGVASEVGTVTRIARLGVEQVRIETTSSTPPLTRIVVDLAGKEPFGIWREGEQGNDLAILFGEAPARPGIAAAPVEPSAAPADAPGDTAPMLNRATQLSGIDSALVDGRLRIVLRGNGRLEPRTIEYARDLPPRVLVDLPGVSAVVKPVTSIGRLGVEKVRVGTNSVSPLVTRVVMDLSQHLPFEVVRDGEHGNDVAVLFGSDAFALKADSDDRRRGNPVLEMAPLDPADLTATGSPSSPNGPVSEAAMPPSDAPDASEPPPWMRSVPRSVGGQSAPSPVESSQVTTAGGGRGYVGVRGFRAALGVGYDQWSTEVRNGYNFGYDSSVTSPLVTLQGSLWLVDPRILTIDALADLRFDWQRYASDVLETKTTDTLENYRVNMVVLSGRGSPLSLYFDRASSLLDQRQNATLTGDVLTLSQTGRQSTRGFSWDFNSARLPHVSASGSVTDRSNLGSFLSGWDSSSRQDRLDLRADKQYRLFRFDLSYSHDKSRFEYPLAMLSTNYAVDVVRGTTSITPRPGLNVTGGARMTMFDVGRTDDLDRQRSFSGAGGNLGVQWRWTPSWRLEAHYNTSTNENELALSLATGSPAPPTGGEGAVVVRRRFLYQDFDGRVTYTGGGGATVASVFVRGLSLDPIGFGTPTLDTLTMAGGQVDVRRGVSGFDLTLGAEAAAGQSSSNRGDTAPYHEAAGRIQASRRLATLTFSANANIRDTGGSYFYPVTGQSWSGGLDLTYDASRRFQLRGSASRSFLLRDVVFQRGDDHTESYRAGLRGPRFEVAVEYADTRSTAKGLLETAWLADANPDVLLATRPDLFGVLYASQQLRRALDARMTVLRGLDVFARGRLDRLELPNPQGTGYLNQNIGQVGATLGVRQLQLEIGWEYLEYWSHLVSTVDRRFLVRVRRDLVVR